MWELLVSFTGAGLLTFGQSWVCCFLLFTIYLHAKLTVSWVRIQWTDMTEASIFSSNKRANQPDTIPLTSVMFKYGEKSDCGLGHLTTSLHL